MTLYTTFLFLHFLGIVGLFSASVMMLKVGSRLRRAPTVEEVRIWLGFARTVAPFFPVSGILLLVTGAHMAGSQWSFTLPWVITALVVVLGLLPTGPLVQRPRFMAMGKAAADAGSGPVPPELRRALTDPVIWVLAHTAAGAATGLLWIMTQKPLGWAGALAPVVVLAAGAGFGGAKVAARDREAAGATTFANAPAGGSSAPAAGD